MVSAIRLFALLFILSSCQEEIPCTSFVLGEPVEIPFKETVTHCSESISITFLDLISDSRCPIDATCIWAGMVEVRISVQINGQEDILNLSSQPNFGQKVPDMKVLNGYSVKLIDLKPFPDLHKNLNDKDLQLILLVEKTDGKD